MSSVPPNGRLRIELQHVKAVNAELLAACEAALNDRMFKDWPEVATLLKNAIAKAKA